MIGSAAFAGKRFAVLGLARSGVATVEALAASGAEVVAWDGREEARSRVSVPLADPLAIDLAGFAGVVVSPGVPLNRHPIAAKAQAAGVPVIGDIELFAQARGRLPAHRVVGITGTNGKSTTTALIHHIIAAAGIPTTMGGNIGLPILGQAPLPEGGVYVLELSSYQIDLTASLDCDVAVLTNITPDHLDRYDGFAGYAASKARLFAMQSAGHVAVIATEDDETRAVADWIAAEKPLPFRGGVGVGALHGHAGLGETRRPHPNPSPEGEGLVVVASTDVGDQSGWPSLQGPHNAQNVAVARAAARALGIAEDVIERALASYPGLPHRMERVAERAGVLFVNDSKATNPTSTAPALMAYPAIHWIAGGQAKTDDLDACKPGFGHVRAAYVIGEAAELFARLLSPHMPVTNTGTLDEAVRAAAAAAAPGETVLLSPACASFDQFRDFEARGDAFRAAVEALP